MAAPPKGTGRSGLAASCTALPPPFGRWAWGWGWTALTYKGRGVRLGQVGRDLNVRYLLQGSVIADADRVRVNAQLIESQTSTELWAERFDKKRQNVLEIQDQIVGRLSRAVGLQLVDIEARRSERERPGNPTAVDFVMRGQAI